MTAMAAPSVERGREARRGDVEVSRRSLAEMAGLRQDWRELVARAVEPNILHGPDVSLPALETFAPQAEFLVAHRSFGTTRRLVGLLPLWRPRLGFGVTARLPTVFSNEFAPLGTPLVDAERSEEILIALLAGASRLGPGLVFTHLSLEGAFHAALTRAVAAAGHQVIEVERHQRASLAGGSDGACFVRDHISRKRRKEWARQLRRLTETGEIRMSFARGAEARAAFADFVVLEASGWKGRQHSALVQDRAVLHFAERMVDGLADSGQIVVERIDRGGQAVAMLVCLGAEGHWVTWKTAYDEAFAPYSPGAQVMLRATTRFLDEGDLVEVDSLAVEDHPLMHHLWSGRRTIGTVVVGFPAPLRLPTSVRLAAAEIGLYMRLRRNARRLKERLGR